MDEETFETPINHWKNLLECDISGFTLVVPSVAVGNVAQLAADLVISSLEMKKMALIYSPAVIPIAGYNPYKAKSSSLTGCCEIYLCEAKKLVLLLLRAPLVYKYSEQFLIEVVDKFKTQNIKDIIILTSSFAHEKRHIMTSPFRYAVNPWCPYVSKIQALDWVEHEPKVENVRILGGGFASLMYKIIRSQSVACLVIYKFASEGDNIADAVEMVQYLNCILELFEDPEFYHKLVEPESWKLLFGGPAPRDIY